jgi:hypothetical protein
MVEEKVSCKAAPILGDDSLRIIRVRTSLLIQARSLLIKELCQTGEFERMYGGLIGIEKHSNAGIQWPPGQSTSFVA